MATASGKPRRARKGTLWKNLSEGEVLSIVANLFVGGMKPSDIVEHMHVHYGEMNFKQQHPYYYLRLAAAKGMFEFALSNANDLGLQQRIRRKYTGLTTVEVVPTVVASDVAERAAKVFIELVQQKVKLGVKDVRVGLMGGGTIMAVCRALARALARLEQAEKQRWPRLTFQALAVGESVREPLEDPASFFTYFADATLNPLCRDYISLHAPVFSAPGERAIVTEEFKQLRKEAQSCDIVLISAGTLADAHSFLGGLSTSAPEIWQKLSENDCKGDLGRLPVSAQGPLPLDLFTNRPCTLVALQDLQDMVKKDRRVLLVVAPCGDCHAHKGDIIETLLDLRHRGIELFNDLVCDSLSARNMRNLLRDPPRNA